MKFFLQRYYYGRCHYKKDGVVIFTFQWWLWWRYEVFVFCRNFKMMILVVSNNSYFLGVTKNLVNFLNIIYFISFYYVEVNWGKLCHTVALVTIWLLNIILHHYFYQVKLEETRVFKIKFSYILVTCHEFILLSCIDWMKLSYIHTTQLRNFNFSKWVTLSRLNTNYMVIIVLELYFH